MENDSEQKGEKENESDIIVALCIAIADHKGSSADELSFKKKDIVKILQAPKEEKRKKQFYGELVQTVNDITHAGKTRGWFPMKKVKLLALSGDPVLPEYEEKEKKKRKFFGIFPPKKKKEEWREDQEGGLLASHSSYAVPPRPPDFKAKVFGLPLYECMRSEEDGTLQLPPFVVQCVAFFRERYLKEQGLFRVPGATAEVAALRETFDRGEIVNLADVSVTNVASLFKLFFAELPEPLLTFHLYDQFATAIKIEDNAKREAKFTSLLEILPASNRMVLDYLLVFLGEVSSHSDENKMTPSNLGIVFGPNLLRQKEPNIKDLMNGVRVAGEVLTFLIEWYLEKRKSLEAEDNNPPIENSKEEASPATKRASQDKKKLDAKKLLPKLSKKDVKKKDDTKKKEEDLKKKQGRGSVGSRGSTESRGSVESRGSTSSASSSTRSSVESRGSPRNSAEARLARALSPDPPRTRSTSSKPPDRRAFSPPARRSKTPEKKKPPIPKRIDFGKKKKTTANESNQETTALISSTDDLSVDDLAAREDVRKSIEVMRKSLEEQKKKQGEQKDLSIEEVKTETTPQSTPNTLRNKPPRPPRKDVEELKAQRAKDKERVEALKRSEAKVLQKIKEKEAQKKKEEEELKRQQQEKMQKALERQRAEQLVAQSSKRDREYPKEEVYESNERSPLIQKQPSLQKKPTEPLRSAASEQSSASTTATPAQQQSSGCCTII